MSRRPRSLRPSGARTGALAESYAASWLETRGWTVHRAQAALIGAAAVRGRMISRRTDLFGALDLLAIRRDHVLICGGCRVAATAAAHSCACGWDGIVAVATWAWQVTTRNVARARKRRLESVGWPRDWRVSLAVYDPERVLVASAWRIEDLVEERWCVPITLEGETGS